MVQKLLNSKQKILKLWQLSIMFRKQFKISKYFSIGNMKKTGLNDYVYDFLVDCNAIPVDDILDIHKYLKKKNNII